MTWSDYAAHSHTKYQFLSSSKVCKFLKNDLKFARESGTEGEWKCARRRDITAEIFTHFLTQKLYTAEYNSLSLQRWAKEWALGCVNSPIAAGGSQEAGFTQPRAHSFAQPCTWNTLTLELILKLDLRCMLRQQTLKWISPISNTMLLAREALYLNESHLLNCNRLKRQTETTNKLYREHSQLCIADWTTATPKSTESGKYLWLRLRELHVGGQRCSWTRDSHNPGENYWGAR